MPPQFEKNIHDKFCGIPKKDIQLIVRSGKKIFRLVKIHTKKILATLREDRMSIFIHAVQKNDVHLPQCLAK